MIKDILKDIFDKKVLILGYGLEGKSTYNLIRNLFPDKKITIADRNQIENADFNNTEIISGQNYLSRINDYELIIKSPGIALHKSGINIDIRKIRSQTDIFLQLFSKQTIGITGTKGKSTTSSLIYHILKKAGKNVILVGNIGKPCFDSVDKIKEDTIIVFELSSHQLFDIQYAPHIGILLNIFPEHLDYYNSYEEYIDSKLNIGYKQSAKDVFIYYSENEEIVKRISKIPSKRYSFSIDDINADCHRDDNFIVLDNQNIYNLSDERKLAGPHNIKNIMASILGCSFLGIRKDDISNGINTFQPLRHRLEYVGCFDEVHYYNDSIATIPEATIEALKTIGDVETLILGGMDRGIDYSKLVNFLKNSTVINVIFIGGAGLRIKELLGNDNNIKAFYFDDFTEAIMKAKKVTMKNKVCLLSPAASSYDKFKNFEQRGDLFIKLISK